MKTCFDLYKRMYKLPLWLRQVMWETSVWSLGQEDPWRRKWLPTPVFLPGEFRGQRSLVGYSPWGHKESDKTERLTHTFHLEWKCLFTRPHNLTASSLGRAIAVWYVWCPWATVYWYPFYTEPHTRRCAVDNDNWGILAPKRKGEERRAVFPVSGD